MTGCNNARDNLHTFSELLWIKSVQSIPKLEVYVTWGHVVANAFSPLDMNMALSAFSPLDMNMALSWRNLSVHRCNRIITKNVNNFTPAVFRNSCGRDSVGLVGLNIANVIEFD